ncbi:MAG: DUF2341 domain-containing protein, partial [Methanobacterium paludis]|nr:DUF2341 domain-containing protein [Methanobacterium paludis]
MVDYSAWTNVVTESVPGSIDGILTNQPVAYKVYWNPNIKPDFSDVRFALTDGKSLEYCLVDYQSCGYADFLVLIPSLPASPSSLDVNVYYGNPTVVSQSNPDAVYLLHDDFDSTTLNTSKWNLDGGKVSISDSIATITNTAGDWLNLSSVITTFGVCIVEMRIKKTDSNLRVGLTNQHLITSGSVILLYYGTSGKPTILTCSNNVCDQS